MKILLAASEFSPYAKTGGLADVTAALSRELARADCDVRVVLPYYRRIRESGLEVEPLPGVAEVEVELGGRSFRWRALARREEGGALLVFVDCPELFDGEELYGGGEEEALRFALLSRACLDLCQLEQWSPDVVHVHDWHTALVPLYLRTLYAWDRLFEGTKTALTIHNLGYQGIFSSELLGRIGLGGESHLMNAERLEQGQVSLLEIGLKHADVLTTVSETYAREIQTAQLGMGMEELLAERSADLVGIVNGVDYDTWNPEVDPHIPSHYSAADLSGKARCKEVLLGDLGLPHDPRVPVLGVVSRLTPQKGFELLPDALPVLLQREDMRLVVLGSGEESYERYFEWLQLSFPGKVCFFRGYNEELAHRIEAGSDLFLMPSRYEPCGLNQMYSLRYGTAPVVRRTGGLADTVVDFDASSRQGTGFVFDEFESGALLGALERALAVWREPELWGTLVQNAMAQDFSWERQVRPYLDLYRSLLAR